VLGAVALTSFARRFADETMYVFFVGAVAVVAWRSGWLYGLAALAVSVLAVDYWFIEPLGSLRLLSAVAISRLLSFAVVSLVLLFVIRALRIARWQSEGLASASNEAREAAERVSAERARFLSTLSHEVRTPISAVLGYADLLEAGTAGALTVDQLQLLRRVRVAAHHLLAVVNGVLDLAKAEAGHLPVQHHRVRLCSAIDAAIALTAPQAAAKHISVSSDGVDTALACVGDADRIRQILINLLGNAVKFTPRDGRVVVAAGLVASENPAVWISVRDSGPGISPDDQARIFEPFEQASVRPLGDTGGAGLGLAISRQLARLQSGSLSVTSELGHGACFTLTLPRAGQSWSVSNA